jgi:2-furoyl-CoA dehydrogenase large subunit
VGARMLEGAAKVVLTQLFEQLGRQASGKSAGSGNAFIQKIRSWLGGQK